MNNAAVEQLLNSCRAELLKVEGLVCSLGVAADPNPYLTKFALIRACGCIEVAFKSIIADYCEFRSKPQVKQFIGRRVRSGSANPSFENICKLLKDFDDAWKTNFKSLVDSHPDKTQLKNSLQSIVDARNEFAHGGNPTITAGDVLRHFDNSRKLLDILDQVVS